MKNLEKNKNIYVQHGRFYIDCQKDGVRIRRATGLKNRLWHLISFVKIMIYFSALNPISRRLNAGIASSRTCRPTDSLEKKRGGEKGTGTIKNSSEFSFDSVIDRLLAEKSFLKDKTRRLYVIMSHTITEFLCSNSIFYLADFERHHSVEFVKFCKDKGLKDSSISGYCSFSDDFRYAVSMT